MGAQAWPVRWPENAAEYAIDRNPDGSAAWASFSDNAYDSLIIYHGDDMICTFERDGDESERAETEALAQLYATAPRLYAALLGILNRITAEEQMFLGLELREAEAALYAARGEPL